MAQPAADDERGGLKSNRKIVLPALIAFALAILFILGAGREHHCHSIFFITCVAGYTDNEQTLSAL